jgi:cation/acetate symporter
MFADLLPEFIALGNLLPSDARMVAALATHSWGCFSPLLASVDPARTWTWIFVGISFALYLYIGWSSRVRDTEGFYVAGKGIPAIANGAATAADWMSAASFMGMTGMIAALGSDGSVYLMGWTGGYVLLALLLAPYLRRFGHYTVPDFIAARYYSETARVISAICAIFISITYVSGQMKGVGVVFSRFLEIPLTYGVMIGMVIVAFFAVLGGMKGITWTQVVQYFILITAFLVPSVAMSSMLAGNPVPHFAMVTSDISERLNAVLLELGEKEYTQPFRNFDRLNVFCITVALMFGTAGLPHVIVRFYTVKSVRAARYSAAWALLFIAVLYTTAPALAMLARYNLITSLHDARIVGIVESEPNQRLEKPILELVSASGETLEWATRWQRTGLLVLRDLDGDGRISMKRESPLAPTDVQKMDADIVVLSTPEIAGLPAWLIALVAAGGLAAALSTASGLLLVISSSLAHDLFVRYFAPNATETQKVTIGRVAILFGILIAGYFGSNPPGFVAETVAFAFGLAAASFFPVICLGIFSTRVNRTGAICGMLTGMIVTLTYITLCVAHKVLPTSLGISEPILAPENYFLGIVPEGFGAVGMLLNFLVALTVSYCTAPPPRKIVELVEELRLPG